MTTTPVPAALRVEGGRTVRSAPSFGRQESPKPSPGRKACPIRGSQPAVRSASSMFVSGAAQSLATSLEKLIFMARNVLLMYLAISAVVGVVVTHGQVSAPYSSRRTSVIASHHAPDTTRE